VNKRALITGNAGFVGRHFEKFLRDDGWLVHGVDIVNKGQDARAVFRCVDEYYHLVIHCAAIVGGRKVIDGAPLALASNLELDAGLFQWGLRSRPQRIVYFSSSAAYPVSLQGLKSQIRLREGHLDPALNADMYQRVGVPDQLYGWAKLTGENLAWRYKQEGGRVTVVRPFSGYGEDQDAAYPFPAFIDRALRREYPFEVWGDGRQVRDFIHIDDIVNATMKMVKHDIDGPVNLGWGRPTSMLELARSVCDAAGYFPEIRTLSSEPSGVQYRVCDPAMLLDFYESKISLEEGIHRALAYRS
jgi:nucleoside-diphosphate-sugar epimerase